jgi:AcrR family transcriptional regulator
LQSAPRDERLPRTACDLDLLLFFVRHPHSLLTSQELVALVGYDVAAVADSVERLLAAGVLTSSRNTTHAGSLYALEASTLHGGPWFALVQEAETREGRLRVMRALKANQAMEP